MTTSSGDGRAFVTICRVLHAFESLDGEELGLHWNDQAVGGSERIDQQNARTGGQSIGM